MPNHSVPYTTLDNYAPDPRADGGLRTIRFTPRRVHIERSVAGIKMRLAIPVEAYRGVVLRRSGQPEQELSRIVLVHRDPDLSVVVHRLEDMPAVLAVWEDRAGGSEEPAAHLEPETSSTNPGEKICDKSASRRRCGATLAQRRPRILMRRRPMRLDSAAKIIRPFRELFSREQMRFRDANIPDART